MSFGMKPYFVNNGTPSQGATNWNPPAYPNMDPYAYGSPGMDAYFSSSYSNQTVVPDNFIPASQMRSELEAISAQLHQNSDVFIENKGTMILQVADLQAKLANLSDDTPPPKELLDQFMVLDAQLATQADTLAKANQEKEKTDQINELVGQMNDLSKTIVAKLADPNLSDKMIEQFKDLQTKLATERSALKLDSTDEDLNQAQEAVANLQTDFNNAADAASQATQDKIDSVSQKIGDFVSNQDNFSGIGKDDKEDYVGQLKDLKDQVKDRKISAEEAGKKFDKIKEKVKGLSAIGVCSDGIQSFIDSSENFSGLQKSEKAACTAELQDLAEKVKNKEISTDDAKASFKDIQSKIKKMIGKDKKIDALKQQYPMLPTLVPHEGYGVDRAISLTEDISLAVKNGAWSQVRATLDDLKKNHEQEMDNAMRQFAGTIFYGVCQQDLKATKEMLSVIPKDILNKMADLLLGCGEVDANDYAEESAKKLKSFYYGTGRQTAELFREAASMASDA